MNLTISYHMACVIKCDAITNLVSGAAANFVQLSACVSESAV